MWHFSPRFDLSLQIRNHNALLQEFSHFVKCANLPCPTKCMPPHGRVFYLQLTVLLNAGSTAIAELPVL